MPKFLIKNNQNVVVNTIIATVEFVQANYTNWEEVIEAPPIPEIISTTITLREFFDRFTDQEAKAILAAIKNQPSAELWWEKLKLLPHITKENPVILQGLNYMVGVNMITKQRMDQILGW